MLRGAVWLATITGLALGLASPAAAGTAPKPKPVKLACELKSNGSLRFITRTRQCRSRVGKLVKIAPGPVSVCVRKRGKLAKRRIANQVAACSRSRRSNETRLQLPSARDEFFCVEKKSKTMRHFKRRPRCRARGKFKEFLAFVPKTVPAPAPAPAPAPPPQAANSAPRAEADSASLDEDSTSAIAVLANDVDPDGDPLAVSAVDTSGTVGSVTVGPGGAVTYNAAGRFNDLGPGESASDSFTYTASDSKGAQSGSARVQVTIDGVNDAPSLSAGAGAPSTFTEDQAGEVPVDSGISVADVDSDQLGGATATIAGGRTTGDTLHFADTAQITGTYNSGTGVLTLAGDASVAAYQDALRSVEFSTSNQNPGTSRSVEFRADDGDVSAPTARAVVVTPVNDAPVADDDDFAQERRAVGNTSLVVNDPSDGAPDPAGPQKTVSGDILANDSDVDGPALSVRPETVGTIDGGQVVLEADGDFTYHPPQGCTGGSEDTFEYTVEDKHPSAELTATAKATIAVADCVWYVDDSAAAGGDGRSHAPYNTLADLDGAGGAGDEDASSHRLFLYDGTYTGGLPLESNQSLLSEKHGLAPADGGTGTVTLEPADGVGTQLQGGLQLASGNTVQGVDLGTTGSASVFALSGSSVGTTNVNTQTPGGINNPAGGAVSIAGTSNTVDMRFGELSSSGSSTNAVTLTNASGTFTASSGALQNATGTTVALNGGSADFTFGGALSDNTGQALSIQNKTGGTNDFNGQVTGGSVSLQSNGGTTRFDGGLSVTTSTTTGFSAGSAGTLAITDPNGPGPAPDNRIATSNGRALSVTSTTIHSDDLNFGRISSDGGTSGITLSNTGNAGGLNVTGTGGTCDGEFTCTGGAIKNSTGDGVSLTTVGGGVALTRMFISGADDDGIGGDNLTGSVALNADVVTGSVDNNVSVANTSGALNMTVTDGRYADTLGVTGNDGILIDANNSASQTLSITGSTFSNNAGDHVQASTGSTGTPTQNVTIAGTSMNTTPVGNANIAGGGITISPAGAAVVNATINANNIQNAKNRAIRVDTTGSSTGTDHLDARITNNTIGTQGTARSGSFSSDGILLGANGTARVDALVSGNTIREWSNTHGIFIAQSGPSPGPTLNATITGNLLANPSAALGGAGGVFARAGVLGSDAGVVCLDLGGAGSLANNLGGAGTSDSPPGQANDIRLEQAGTAAMQFPSLGATPLATYLANRNTGSPSVSTAGSAFQSTNNPCPQPDS